MSSTPGDQQEPSTSTEPAGESTGPDDRSLTRDLDEVQAGRPERAFNLGAALGILVTVAAVIFVLQNRRSTTFDWLWFEFELPLWTVLVGGVAVGVVLVLTALAVHARRQRRIGRRHAAAGRLRGALTRPRHRDPSSEPSPT